MISAYFWDAANEQVLEHFAGTTLDSIPFDFHGLYCVDMYTDPSDSTARYGQYWAEGWRSVPLQAFPPQFRLALLLLGVS